MKKRRKNNKFNFDDEYYDIEEDVAGFHYNWTIDILFDIKQIIITISKDKADIDLLKLLTQNGLEKLFSEYAFMGLMMQFQLYAPIKVIAKLRAFTTELLYFRLILIFEKQLKDDKKKALVLAFLAQSFLTLRRRLQTKSRRKYAKKQYEYIFKEETKVRGYGFLTNILKDVYQKNEMNLLKRPNAKRFGQKLKEATDLPQTSGIRCIQISEKDFYILFRDSDELLRICADCVDGNFIRILHF